MSKVVGRYVMETIGPILGIPDLDNLVYSYFGSLRENSICLDSNTSISFQTKNVYGDRSPMFKMWFLRVGNVIYTSILEGKNRIVLTKASDSAYFVVESEPETIPLLYRPAKDIYFSIYLVDPSVAYAGLHPNGSLSIRAPIRAPYEHEKQMILAAHWGRGCSYTDRE